MRYQAGGALPRETESYVMREADYALRERLLHSEFCYVLTPRQMGKSSLMVQTASALQNQGIACAIIDLSAQGYELTSEQFYKGLLDTLADRLDLEDEMKTFYQAQVHLSPIQCWQRALREVVLEHCIHPVVIFLDEIDITRRLVFETDEFFAAIRACFNARSHDHAYNRLTFCLLGVASPSDLIIDTRVTPFNVGDRIDLQDFTLNEAALLRLGLGHDDATNQLLLERIYYWTQGHPYLTQRLCKVVAGNEAILTARGVDACCHKLFLGPFCGRTEPNLLFVSSRLAVEEAEACASLLTLFLSVLAGKPVLDNEAAAGISNLKLSGVVKSRDRYLVIRNPIYEAVFDKRWVRDHMPDDDVRRQRAAYRLGVLRTVAVSALIVAAMGGLGIAVFHRSRANAEAHRADAERNIAAETRRNIAQLLYAADMNIVQQTYEHGDYARAGQLLDAHRPDAGEPEDLRGFEWFYYWKLLHTDIRTRQHQGGSIVYSSAFSPDGRILASSNNDSIQLWNPATGEAIGALRNGHTKEIVSIAWSPQGRYLASGSFDHLVLIWDSVERRIVHTFHADQSVFAVAWSPDGRWLTFGGQHGSLKLVDMKTKKEAPFPLITPAMNKNVYSLVFSADGKWLALARFPDPKWTVLEVASGRIVFSAPPHKNQTAGVESVAFSHHGATLAVGRTDGVVELWDIARRNRVTILRKHRANVAAVTFSNDDKFLATGSSDNTVSLWDLDRKVPVHTFIGHRNRVTSVSFSPNNRLLASTGSDEIKIWNPWKSEAGPYEQRIRMRSHQDIPAHLAYSKQGALLEIWSEPGKIHAMDLVSGKLRADVPETSNEIMLATAISPDLSRMAIGRNDGTVAVWNLLTRQRTATFTAEDRKLTTVRAMQIEAVTFNPSGRLLAVASGDPARVTIWDLNSKQQIGVFMHGNNAEGIALSSDGKLAAANWQGDIYMWDLAKKRQWKWKAHTTSVLDVAFSPDGKTLATAGEDETVKLWNTATQRELCTFREHASVVVQVAFSRDGSTLATLGADQRVLLYRASSLQKVDSKDR